MRPDLISVLFLKYISSSNFNSKYRLSRANPFIAFMYIATMRCNVVSPLPPQVLFSDTDTFQHANYLTYIRFCQKALRQAVTECMRGATTSGQKQTTGKLDQSSAWPRKVTADVMRKGVKSAKCRYFNECVGGDEVTVHLWEENDKPLWVFFSVETNTPASNILRFQMSIEYFKP